MCTQRNVDGFQIERTIDTIRTVVAQTDAWLPGIFDKFQQFLKNS
jgi:hypothetical protein